MTAVAAVLALVLNVLLTLVLAADLIVKALT